MSSKPKRKRPRPRRSPQTPAGALPPMEHGLYMVQTEAQLDALLAEEAPVVVDFWAPWCGPCKRLTPVFQSMAEELDGSVRFAKVNVDETPSLAQRFAVRGIPTVLGFAGGELQERQVGFSGESGLRELAVALLPEEERPEPPVQDEDPSFGERIRRFFAA